MAFMYFHQWWVETETTGITSYKKTALVNLIIIWLGFQLLEMDALDKLVIIW